jgi:hypothetical protein
MLVFFPQFSLLNNNSTSEKTCLLDSIIPADCITNSNKSPLSISLHSYIYFKSPSTSLIPFVTERKQRNNDVKKKTYRNPINCSVELDCMLFVRSSSHHSGNDDWKFGKPSASNRKKEKIRNSAIKAFIFSESIKKIKGDKVY